MVVDVSQLGVYAFVIGAFLAYLVTWLRKYDPSPNVQLGVTMVVGFMGFLAYAVTGGQLAVAAPFIGVVSGWVLAIQFMQAQNVMTLKDRLSAMEEMLKK